MVVYCCVRGCGNNSNNRKKYPTSAVSFHAFPSNIEARQKWLLAIGRANWNPPSHSRICSAHFSADQINFDNTRVRIQDQACPVIGLPPNSNFEASDLEVCRICLATDVKMYSLQNDLLNNCIASIVGLNENTAGLPQYVCYECAALLIKSNKLVEKSIIAQATLLDIFSQHGQITHSLIRNQNRSSLNLTSSLKIDKRLNKTIHYKHVDEENSSYFFIKSDAAEEKFKLEDAFETTESNNFKTELKDCKIEESNFLIEENHQVDDDENDEERNDVQEECFVDSGDDDIVENLKKKTRRKRVSLVELEGDSKRVKKRTADGWTLEEISMQEFYNIEILTLEEQIEEFKKAEKAKSDAYKHECDICSKMFTNLTSLESHLTGHDPDRGPGECAVCKLRFKNSALAKAHIAYAHGKKFSCKACPKVFKNVAMAKKHHMWHTGFVYECSHCSFTTAHESALGVHERRMHRGLACKRYSRTFVSEDTPAGELNSKSHVINGSSKRRTVQHKTRTEECDALLPDLRTICKTCGQHCATVRDLMKHRRSEHPRKRESRQHRTEHPRERGQKKVWSMPGDSFPKKCEYCDTMLDCRKDHWAHIRKVHPNEKASYKSVITAVCEICGQGFQNTARLRLHELRHNAPTVRCEICSKMFYDKFLLATHMETHSDARPYRCRTCGRGFKTRANLEKHHRTHSDVAAYECSLCGKKFKYSTSMNLHIRTVHYKIPLPPRKKRTRKNVTNNINNISSND